MPDFKDLNQLWLFLAFFVPGFVSLKVWDLFVPTPRRDFSKLLAEVLGYSALSNAVLIPLWVLLNAGAFPLKHPVWYARLTALLIFLGLMILPILWPLAWLRICDLPWVARRILHPFQRPWDWVFRNRPRRFVLVTLKDGRRIAGLFGEAEGASPDESPPFATSNVIPEQIFLTRTLKLDSDGHFAGWVLDSKGVLILSDIQTVEFFWPEGTTEDASTLTAPAEGEKGTPCLSQTEAAAVPALPEVGLAAIAARVLAIRRIPHR